jgi:putative Holliday junction resolvase
MRLLGLDVGERRIGVAVSDANGVLATPWTILKRRSRREDFAAVQQLVDELGADRVIVGHPRSLDGTAGPQAQRVERYASALAQVLTVPVVLWDERYTTIEARERLGQAGVRGREQRRRLDAAAAAVLLQDYLDSRRF